MINNAVSSPCNLNFGVSQFLLKFNDDKSELMVFHSQHNPRPDISSIGISGTFGAFDATLAQIRCQLWSMLLLPITELDYGNSLLDGHPKYLIKRLQCVQNAAARLVSGCRKYDHISPALRQLHWLPVDKRISFKVLLMVLKCLHNLAPLYLCETIVVSYKPTRALPSGSKNYLVVPYSTTRGYGDRAFSVYGPGIWSNTLEHSPSWVLDRAQKGRCPNNLWPGL